MRDAFGGTFMFKLIIIFIVMYVTFATIAVSYAKTFRLKNKVIDIIEQSQYDYKGSSTVDVAFSANSVINEVDKFLARNNYNHREKVEEYCNNTVENGLRSQVTFQGACILPIKYKVGKSQERYYYRVTLYMVVSIPLINYDAVIPISGETEDFSQQVMK